MQTKQTEEQLFILIYLGVILSAWHLEDLKLNDIMFGFIEVKHFVKKIKLNLINIKLAEQT